VVVGALWHHLIPPSLRMPEQVIVVAGCVPNMCIMSGRARCRYCLRADVLSSGRIPLVCAVRRVRFDREKIRARACVCVRVSLCVCVCVCVCVYGRFGMIAALDLTSTADSTLTGITTLRFTGGSGVPSLSGAEAPPAKRARTGRGCAFCELALWLHVCSWFCEILSTWQRSLMSQTSLECCCCG